VIEEKFTSKKKQRFINVKANEVKEIVDKDGNIQYGDKSLASNKSGVSSNSTSDEVQTAELENYLTYQSTLTDDQIIEHLDVSDLNNIDIESNVTNEEIEAILMENTDIEYQLIN
jgi:hypothetical protein